MNSEGPDQNAHACRMVRTFTVHVRNLLLKYNQQDNSDGLDQTAHDCRMIRTLAAHVKILQLWKIPLVKSE